MSDKVKVVIQSFGAEYEYHRALLASLSFFAKSTIAQNKVKLLLYTDNPQFFNKYLLHYPVDYIYLGADKIREYRGEIDFLHRIKIAIIEDAFNRGDGDILYIDSDTFFIDDPKNIIDKVDEQTAFMHLYEYKFDDLKTWDKNTPFYKVWEIIQSKRINSIDEKLNITLEDVSFNAGVMAFHSSHKSIIPKVYDITERFYRNTLSHASEQYAFSVILQKNFQVLNCEEVVYHYWYRVKKNVADLYLKNFFDDFHLLSPEEQIKKVQVAINELPGLFRNHILILRDNSINEFYNKKYFSAYIFAFRSLLKDPFNKKFFKDIMYHTKRIFIR